MEPMETDAAISAETTSNTNNDDKVFEVNQPFYLKRSDEYQKCQIVQIRTTVQNKKEYYIHYIGLNRRLDEWVGQDKINESKTEEQWIQAKKDNARREISRPETSKGATKENSKIQPSSDNALADKSDRKMTRHQKRRHDEINHVEKTFAEMDPTTAALGKSNEKS